MARPRRPPSERAVQRAFTLRPWADEFLTTISPGERSRWLNDLIEGSEEFRRWWAAIEGEKSP